MLNNNLKKIKILPFVVLLIVFLSIILLAQSLISLENNSDIIVNKSIDSAQKEKEKELKNYITLAYKTINSYYIKTSKDKIKVEVEDYIKEQTEFLFSILNNEYEKNKDILAPEVLKNRLISIVKATRYGKSGYFWINDFDYKMIMHPINKELSGKYFENISSLSFVKSGVDELKKTKKDVCFVEYPFYNPSTKNTVYKSSILKIFKPYNWILGTGAYLDDFTEKMKKEALLAISHLKYGENGYFWIINSKHILLMDGVKGDLPNQNMYDVKNKDGIYLYREIVKTANREKNGNFVKYFWNIPNKIGQYEKLSYVRNFEPWDFIIGTGAYIIDIKKNSDQLIKEADKNMPNVIRIILLFVMMMFLIILLIINRQKKEIIEEKIKNKTIELDNLNKSLEKKVTLRTKNLEEQKLILQRIIDSQKSMLIVTDFTSISFINKEFLEFFNIKDKKEFEKKYKSILDIFCEFGDYLHVGKLNDDLDSIGESFYELVKNSEEDKRVVLILNSKLVPKSFFIQMTLIDDSSGLYSISLMDITKITIEKICAEQKAYIDGLTGIANRNKFNIEFEKELIRAKRYNTTFSMIILDIDHFKKFNDNFGHLIGDEILIILAQECEKHIRKTDFFSRWGGEEFLLLLPETKLEEAILSANKIRVYIEKLEHKIAGNITCSFGVTEYKIGDNLDNIFTRCDEALYKAKKSGRNRVESI